MAKAMLTRSPEWWKHLRRYNKRLFWKRERKAGKARALALQMRRSRCAWRDKRVGVSCLNL